MSNKIHCPLNKLIINLENKAKHESGNKSYVYPDTMRCHTCKRELELDRFYSSKGIIDRFKCKGCYHDEFKRLMRESLL